MKITNVIYCFVRTSLFSWADSGDTVSPYNWTCIHACEPCIVFFLNVNTAAVVWMLSFSKRCLHSSIPASSFWSCLKVRNLCKVKGPRGPSRGGSSTMTGFAVRGRKLQTWSIRFKLAVKPEYCQSQWWLRFTLSVLSLYLKKKYIFFSL